MIISVRGKTWKVRAPPSKLSGAAFVRAWGRDWARVKKFERLGTRLKFNMAAAVVPQPLKKTLSKNLMEMKVGYSKVTIKYLYSTLFIFLFIFSSWGGKQNQTIAANLKKSDNVRLKNRIGYWTRKKKMIGQAWQNEIVYLLYSCVVAFLKLLGLLQFIVRYWGGGTGGGGGAWQREGWGEVRSSSHGYTVYFTITAEILAHSFANFNQ